MGNFTPPSNLTIPCNQIARYVIVETMYDAPDDGEVWGPILEICEIEVYGKWCFKIWDYNIVFKGVINDKEN